MLRIACLSLLVSVTLLIAGCTDDSTDKTSGSTGTSGAATTTTTPAESIPLTAVQFQLALELKNKGIAALENLKFAEADLAFTQLRELLPDHPLPIHNLAITRVLSIIDRTSPYARSKDADAYAMAVMDAEAALSSYREQVQGTSAEPFIDLLAGKLAAHDDTADRPRIDEAIRLLTRAAEAREDAAEYWFAVAAAMDEHNQLNRSLKLLQTLEKCRELAPDNLFVVAKLVDTMALGLNANDDSVKQFCQQLPARLQASLPVLQPLSSAIQRQSNVDVVAMVEQATSADDPAAAIAPAMMIKNLIVAELAGQVDRRRIDRNLLEYVQHEFSPLPELAAGVEQQLYPPQPPTVLTGFVNGEGLPDLSGVTQIAFADMNLDGVDDLVVAASAELKVYTRANYATTEWQLMCSFADNAKPVEHFALLDLNRDYDRALSDVKSPALLRDQDGDQKIVTDPAGQHRWYDTALDVVMWGPGGVVIAHNQQQAEAGRQLVAVPQQLQLDNVNDVAGADIEADGDLDLVFASADGLVLWRNTDGANFTAWDSSLALPEYELAAISTADWNRDMAIDIVGVSADGRLGVLENILHGRMRWREVAELGHTTVDLMVSDFNRDAAWDAFFTGSQTGVMAHDGTVRGGNTATVCSGSVLSDFDNDGCLDAMTVAGDSRQLLLKRGAPDGQFRDQPFDLPAGILTGDAFDFDDDGDLDFVAVSAADGSLQLLLNQGGDQNQWIDIVPRAVPNDPQFPANRVNMHAVGGTIEVRAGALYQARVIDKPRMHFGLGTADSLDTIRVTWTDGVPQNILKPELLRGRVGVLAPQILLGSCPYIYTWTGERFEFFSDCLWAAPIGLVQASGDFAPTREWEHLLIPGDRLKERDGRYMLQLTEELWEIAYFDHVQLAAIDHPRGVTVLTNEKVGSPEMAAPRLHTARNPIRPDSVIDKHGRNLLPGLAHQDGDYVQPFDGRVMQGLTDEWTMEFRCQLDKAPTSLRLVLVGWVFPTDTSLNLAIQQNPDVAPPTGPSIEVQDESGAWQTAIPFIGFPGGKTKSIVVDLSSVAKSSDVHFRVRSSMELYFDHAWLIADEVDETVVVQSCELDSADLHYRGFSRRVYASNALFRGGRAPESYAYDMVTTEPRWQPLHGRFTRYGDVTQLLRTQDDHIVVMSPGDEMTVSFAVPSAPVPEGWVRDFVLYNVGWDKDANLNTVYGQSSEPYPFSSMTSYPFDYEQAPTERESYQQYLKEFQTREMQLQKLNTLLLPERGI
jgi:tetratricopeptide (TPR) repeat protein